MVQINPASSNRAKRAAGEAKPNERVNRKLRKKYSVKRGLDENYTPEEKKLHEQHFDTGQEETFFEKIMRGLGLNSNDSSSFFNKRDKFRTAAVDANHPWLKGRKVYAKQLAKEGLVDEIMADSSTGAMMALLTRASGDDKKDGLHRSDHRRRCKLGESGERQRSGGHPSGDG